jgi:hypothetical protein
MIELEDIYEKFKSVMPTSTKEFVVDIDQCQTLFQHYLIVQPTGTWWEQTLPRVYQVNFIDWKIR